jgi:hypothetical protein
MSDYWENLVHKTTVLRVAAMAGLAMLLVGCTRPGHEGGAAVQPTTPATVYPDLPPQRSLEHGGFEFLAPSGYELEFYPGIVFIIDEEEYLYISLGGGYETEPINLEMVIDQTLESLTGDVDELNTAEPVEVTVAGEPGLAVSFQGIQEDMPVEGQVVYVQLENQQSFTMIGIGEQDLWLGEGQALFTNLIETLAFFEATPLTDGCPVSRDPDYGYSPDNPIRVASVVPDQVGPLAGFYFEFLRGPDDETVSYTLVGTTPVENSQLDIYEVAFEGIAQTVELYVDEYHSGQLMVPQGFDCQY